jgi:hypothetical protein
VDRTGSYTMAWLICSLVVVLAIPVTLAATTPHHLIAKYRPSGAPPVTASAASHHGE